MFQEEKVKNFIIPNIEVPNNKEMSDYLARSIEAFSEVTGIPVTFFNLEHEIVKEYRKEEKICNMFNVYCDCSGPCRKNLSSAGQFTSRLGEPYIFLCKSRLTNIATSLIVDGEFVGYFIAGPIVMGKLRHSVTESFKSLNNLDSVAESFAKMYANKMKVYEPNDISRIALLFYNSIITSATQDSDYQALRKQNSQQNRINLDIQNLKKSNVDIEYPYDLEKELIDSVLGGQSEKAVEIVGRLINAFSIMEAGDLEGIKNKALWLFAIILRIASESDNNINQLLDTDLDVINGLSDTENFTEVLELSKSLVQSITDNMLTSIYSGHSQIITKALQYINKGYKDKITLKDIENKLHVNSSYFSTLFKQEMGVTFTDYLNSLKVQYACNLLETTNLSIIDISLSTGFDDQSYFTKVFKKIKGVTPKEWRSRYNTEHSLDK